MARYDIIINTEYGEVDLKKRPTNRYISSATLLGNQSGMDNDHAAYIEVSIIKSMGLSYSINDSLLVQFEYRAVNKPVFVRFLLDNQNESKKEYVINKQNNTIWFPVLFNNTQMPLSSWYIVNNSFLFEFVFQNNGISLYSGYETDLIINASLKQNKNLLLLTRMGNLYRYPLTGVGLLDYLNSNFENTDLAEKLQTEFINDGMVIVNASLNTDTNELNLVVEE